MRNISLKGEKSIEPSSIFINPQSGPEGEILNSYILSNGAENIEGIVVNIEDWKVLRDSLYSRDQTQLKDDMEIENKWKETVFFINPRLPSLSTESNGKIKRIIKMFEFGSDLKEVVEKFNDNDYSDGSVRRNHLYPLLQEEDTVKEILKKQMEIKTDFLIPPVINLTAEGDLERRVEGVKNIIETTEDIKDDEENGIEFEDKDLMYILPIRPDILKEEENRGKILGILEDQDYIDPDLIGFELTDMDYEKTETNKNLFEFLQKVKNDFGLPVFLLNVDEGGYISYYYGVDAISSPTSKMPWFRKSSSSGRSRGNYYHPKKMERISVEDLKEETKENDYQFPCECEFCEEKEKIINVHEGDWSEFRKKHYLACKNSEMSNLKKDGPVEKHLVGLFEDTELDFYEDYLPDVDE